MVRGGNAYAFRQLTMAGFIERTQVANWLNVAAMVATLFCLLSFFILPVKWTHRHYLSICLAIAVAFMEVCGISTSFLHVLIAKARIHHTLRIQA
jgi:hypothetical protein